MDYHLQARLIIYLLLFFAMIGSYAGLLLGVIKRDFIYAGGGQMRRLKGNSAVTMGLVLSTSCGGLAFYLLKIIFRSFEQTTLNYILLSSCIIIPLILVIWKYTRPVKIPKI